MRTVESVFSARCRTQTLTSRVVRVRTGWQAGLRTWGILEPSSHSFAPALLPTHPVVAAQKANNQTAVDWRLESRALHHRCRETVSSLAHGRTVTMWSSDREDGPKELLRRSAARFSCSTHIWRVLSRQVCILFCIFLATLRRLASFECRNPRRDETLIIVSCSLMTMFWREMQLIVITLMLD